MTRFMIAWRYCTDGQWPEKISSTIWKSETVLVSLFGSPSVGFGWLTFDKDGLPVEWKLPQIDTRPPEAWPLESVYAWAEFPARATEKDGAA